MDPMAELGLSLFLHTFSCANLSSDVAPHCVPTLVFLVASLVQGLGSAISALDFSRLHLKVDTARDFSAFAFAWQCELQILRFWSVVVDEEPHLS